MNAPNKKIEAASLHSAMAAAFAEIEAATKTANNPHFKSKYADLGAVIDAIKPSLIAHDLFFTQHPQPCETGVSVETVLHHASGESLSLGTLFVPADRNNAHGFGSALTYARRYGLQTGFGVPAEDDDGNAAASSARPTTGETPPEKRVPLDGPYTSKTALWAAVKQFDRDVRGCGDVDELICLLATPESKALTDQCKRDAPGLWSDGLPDLPEFVPLETLINDRMHEMEELENFNKRTPIDAG